MRVDILKKPHSVTAEIKDEEHFELLKNVLRDHGYPPLSDEVQLPEQTEFNFS